MGGIIMTKKEVKKILDNTKVYVNGKSEEIQEKLFSLGYHWINNSTKIKNIDAPFFIIYDDNTIYKSNHMEYFKTHINREITAEDILSISLEPKYRPFKNAEECWEEMQKHQSLGWIQPKNCNDYIILTFIDNNMNFNRYFNECTFADGTPFGIKEEE